MKITGEISTLHSHPECVAKALDTDNMPHMKTAVRENRVVFTIESDKIRSVVATTDDYLMNLQIAEDMSWKAEELMYGTEKDGLTLMSWASQTYNNAMSPASVTITIQDTLGEPIGNADGWEYFYDFTYPNYEMHAKKVQEYPSWLIFDREADTITQLTMIENRIVVSIDVANGQLTYITPYENAISFKKLAELTK